ncbi:MAG TPA: hypothetical protein VKG45_12425 [Actinomycetes bacterium]|nr:hypothetical protein [Actinomycetes bacterium]
MREQPLPSAMVGASVDEGTMDALLDQLRSESERQRAHFAALDTRLTLVLGLAGVLAAVAGIAEPGSVAWLLVAAAAAAVAAALLALWASLRPLLLTLDVSRAAQELIEAGRDQARYQLLLARLRLVERSADQLARKARWARAAVAALALAALLLAVAAGVGLVTA